MQRCTGPARASPELLCLRLSLIATPLICCKQRSKKSLTRTQAKGGGAGGRIAAARPFTEKSQPMRNSFPCSQHGPKLGQLQELSVIYGQSHAWTLITANPTAIKPGFFSFFWITFYLNSPTTPDLTSAKRARVGKDTKPPIMKAIHFFRLSPEQHFPKCRQLSFKTFNIFPIQCFSADK